MEWYLQELILPGANIYGMGDTSYSGDPVYMEFHERKNHVEGCPIALEFCDNDNQCRVIVDFQAHEYLHVPAE